MTIFLQINHNIVGHSAIWIIGLLTVFGLFSLLMDVIYHSEEQTRIVKIKEPEKISLSTMYDDELIDDDAYVKTNEYFEENYIENT